MTPKGRGGNLKIKMFQHDGVRFNELHKFHVDGLGRILAKPMASGGKAEDVGRHNWTMNFKKYEKVAVQVDLKDVDLGPQQTVKTVLDYQTKITDASATFELTCEWPRTVAA
jgi:hypothetical protein